MHDALKELEHGETSAEIGPYINLEYEKLLAVMETQLYNKAASSCKDEIELYDKMGGIVCLAEKESNFTKVPATYAQFWGGESIMATSIMMVLLILHPCLSKLCMVYRFIATMFVVILFFFSIHHLITVLRHYHYVHRKLYCVWIRCSMPR